MNVQQQLPFSYKKFCLLFLLIGFINCKPTISLYDQYAYTQATNLKVDVQNLVYESDSISYDSAKTDINQINVALQKAYEYNKGRNLNSLSTKQYEILISDKEFYKKFLTDWQTKGTENKALAQDAGDKIGQLFDEIIKLENGKNKSSQ